MNKLLLLLLVPALLFGADIDIKTKGLVCSSCGIGIKKHFGKLDSVKKVTIDEKKHMTYLFLNKDKQISDKLIRITMVKAGYEASKIKRNETGVE
jgi:hypothetical protein|tara:strand:+ start:136 stop:420 length:285 start_codon:yes stop_codon:yes gene_type:complete